MSAAKHTPGPWWVDVHKNVMAAGGMVAFPCISAGFDQAANARLIAAAPELLEAAEQAECACSVRERNSGHRIGCWMPSLRAAIAKATGGAS